MARTITSETGRVALTASLPVDVLMKSEPAIIATTEARPTFRKVRRSPVPRMAFMRAGDDNVDLAGAGFDAAANLLHSRLERREAGGEAGGDGRDGDAGALERF